MVGRPVRARAEGRAGRKTHRGSSGRRPSPAALLQPWRAAAGRRRARLRVLAGKCPSAGVEGRAVFAELCTGGRRERASEREGRPPGSKAAQRPRPPARPPPPCRPFSPASRRAALRPTPSHPSQLSPALPPRYGPYSYPGSSSAASREYRAHPQGRGREQVRGGSGLMTHLPPPRARTAGRRPISTSPLAASPSRPLPRSA